MKQSIRLKPGRSFLAPIFLAPTFLVLTFLVLTLATLAARATDLDYSDKPLFYSVGAKPNVAFVIDSSESMKTRDAGGAGGESVCGSGLIRGAAVGARITAAKEAACAVVERNIANVFLGLYKFALPEGFEDTPQRIKPGTFFPELLADFISDDVATLHSAISGINPVGPTALEEVYYGVAEKYLGAASPIRFRCQKNYIVFFTDGQTTFGNAAVAAYNNSHLKRIASNGSDLIDFNRGEGGTPFTLPSLLTTQQESPWPGADDVKTGTDMYADPETCRTINICSPFNGSACSVTETDLYCPDIPRDDMQPSGKSWDNYPDAQQLFVDGAFVYLYYPWLDDMAQMMYDIDIRTNETPALSAAACGRPDDAPRSKPGKDCAGKSWDGGDDEDEDEFARQNVVTYTVGLGEESNNPAIRNTPLVNRILITRTAVNTSDNTITVPDHGLETGQYIQYHRSYRAASTSTATIRVRRDDVRPGNGPVGDQIVNSDTTLMATGVRLTYNRGGRPPLTYQPSGGTTDVGRNNYFAVVTSVGTSGSFRLALNTDAASRCAASSTRQGCVDIVGQGTGAQTFSWQVPTAEPVIGGLYPYETDEGVYESDPDYSTHAAARGKYYVSVVDSNTIRLHECGASVIVNNRPQFCRQGKSETVNLISSGFGILSTGPGRSYFANTSSELAEALTSTFASIVGEALSFSSIASNSSSGSGTDSRLYQPRFNTSDWSGDVASLRFMSDGQPDEETPEWLASNRLDGQLARGYSRNIWTRKGDTSIEFVPGSFTLLSEDQQESLTGGPGRPDSDGEDVMNWVRGDDVGGLHKRENGVIGDITDSTIVYVAQKPGEDYALTLPSGSEGDTYAAFQSTTESRRPMLYVGSNGGMLHGFDASIDVAGTSSGSRGGEEVFAYIPEGVYFDWQDADDDGVYDTAEAGSAMYKFHELAQPYYGISRDQPHRYFVNGPSTAGDVYFNGAWHTVLVGGLGKGGRSVYALDITDPDSFDSDNLLWEFDEEHLGYTYSRPQIARLHDGRWVAVFGNGFDSAGDKAVIYIVDIKDGGLISKIELDDGSGMDNGVSTTAILQDDNDSQSPMGDRVQALAIYAGDLRGNVWKVDLRSSVASSMTVRTPFFQARDDENPQPQPQPITASIIVERYEVLPGDYDVMLFVSTGRYIATGDREYTEMPKWHAIYGLHDNGSGASIPADKSTLVRQEIGKKYIGGRNRTTLTNNPVDYAVKQGWYIQLASTFMTASMPSPYVGEMIIFPPASIRGFLFFDSIIPEAIDLCAEGGRSNDYTLNALTGGSNPSPIFDTNGDGVIDDKDDASVVGYADAEFSTGTIRVEDYLCTGKTNQKVECREPPDCPDPANPACSDPPLPSSLSGGRTSWRQLQ